MKTRQRSTMVLRKIEWKVRNEQVPVRIIGRKVFESLGLDKSEILIAARDKYGKDIDKAHRLANGRNKERNLGNMVALRGESIFCNSGNWDANGIKMEGRCADLRDELHDEI